MTHTAEKSLKFLQAKAITGIKDFKDLDLMTELGLSYQIAFNVIAELEKYGYIEVDRQYVNSHFTLI